ncbi:hypothetical protein [Vibrio crassostreae]|uniref:hypothetical protein n=1 Tax=Vibrio crassostreae TaxID=246167 RepID=UPI001B30EE31|nr:hypothetical protein [Vibrio crassostreae]
MSVLKNLIEQNEANYKSEGNGRTSLNLPVKVERYDGETVIGERLDTGESITLTLNTFQKKEGSEFDRPTISKIANNGKKSVRAGGVIQFENAYDNGNNEWTARWPRVVTKTEDGDTKAVVGKTKLYFGKAQSGNKFIELKMLWPDRARTITTEDELRQVLAKHLVHSADGVVHLTAIKMKEGDFNATVEARAQLIDSEDEFGNKRRQVNPDSQESVDAFFKTKDGALVLACLNEGENVEITVCNGATLYVGKDTKENTLKKDKSVNFMRNEFLIDKDKDYARHNLGYKDVVVGIRTDGDQKYVTHFLSLNSYDDPVAEADLF